MESMKYIVPNGSLAMKLMGSQNGPTPASFSAATLTSYFSPIVKSVKVSVSSEIDFLLTLDHLLLNCESCST